VLPKKLVIRRAWSLSTGNFAGKSEFIQFRESNTSKYVSQVSITTADLSFLFEIWLEQFQHQRQMVLKIYDCGLMLVCLSSVDLSCLRIRSASYCSHCVGVCSFHSFVE
jgi:hypothetical protein